MDFLFWIGSEKFEKFLPSQKSGCSQKLVKCQTEGVYLYLDNKHYYIYMSIHKSLRSLDSRQHFLCIGAPSPPRIGPNTLGHSSPIGTFKTHVVITLQNPYWEPNLTVLKITCSASPVYRPLVPVHWRHLPWHAAARWICPSYGYNVHNPYM